MSRSYKLELISVQVSQFELIALIKIPDGYPDRGCNFSISLAPGRTAKGLSAEEEKKNMLTKFPESEYSVEPILQSMKKEIEEHYGIYCDSEKY